MRQKTTAPSRSLSVPEATDQPTLFITSPSMPSMRRVISWSVSVLRSVVSSITRSGDIRPALAAATADAWNGERAPSPSAAGSGAAVAAGGAWGCATNASNGGSSHSSSSGSARRCCCCWLGVADAARLGPEEGGAEARCEPGADCRGEAEADASFSPETLAAKRPNHDLDMGR